MYPFPFQPSLANASEASSLAPGSLMLLHGIADAASVGLEHTGGEAGSPPCSADGLPTCRHKPRRTGLRRPPPRPSFFTLPLASLSLTSGDARGSRRQVSPVAPGDFIGDGKTNYRVDSLLGEGQSCELWNGSDVAQGNRPVMLKISKDGSFIGHLQVQSSPHCAFLQASVGRPAGPCPQSTVNHTILASQASHERDMTLAAQREGKSQEDPPVNKARGKSMKGRDRSESSETTLQQWQPVVRQARARTGAV